MRSGSDSGGSFTAFGALVNVGGDGLRAVVGEFAVNESHDFFGGERMCGGAHALSPFWAVGRGVSFDEGSSGGSSKLRSAVRARKRRERTVFRGSCKRSAISE